MAANVSMIEMRDAKPGVKGKHAAKWWTNDERISTESKIEIDQFRTMWHRYSKTSQRVT